jgi:hypothetical protein
MFHPHPDAGGFAVASVGLKQRDAAASVEKTPPTKEKATRTKQATDSLVRKHSFSGKAPNGTWSVAAIPDLGLMGRQQVCLREPLLMPLKIFLDSRPLGAYSLSCLIPLIS